MSRIKSVQLRCQCSRKKSALQLLKNRYWHCDISLRSYFSASNIAIPEKAFSIYAWKFRSVFFRLLENYPLEAIAVSIASFWNIKEVNLLVFTWLVFGQVTVVMVINCRPVCCFLVCPLRLLYTAMLLIVVTIALLCMFHELNTFFFKGIEINRISSGL